MTQNEINELFRNEAAEMFKSIDIYLNQKTLSIIVFEEQSKLSRIKKNNKATVDDLRKIAMNFIRIGKVLQGEGLEFIKALNEFETKGTFQTSIK